MANALTNLIAFVSEMNKREEMLKNLTDNQQEDVESPSKPQVTTPTTSLSKPKFRDSIQLIDEYLAGLGPSQARHQNWVSGSQNSDKPS
jgi:hypothetical protein